MSDLIKHIYDFLSNNKRYRRTVFVLSVIVVFVVSYLLILPAITLEKEKAAEQGGIDVPSVETVEDTATQTAEQGASCGTF